jgi:HAD superfamily hydrolase (TIGR01458 family)
MSSSRDRGHMTRLCCHLGLSAPRLWHRGVVTARLGDIRGVLVDLDGVLYVEDEPVAGAREALARLRGAGVALAFVTNTTSRSRAQTLAKLQRLGFDIAAGELVTPAVLAVAHCLEHDRRRVQLVMNEEVKEDFAELIEDDGAHADAVIVGDLGEAFGYDVLNRAFRAVIAGAELIALQKNRYWLRADGLSLDVGPFVAALEYATRREALVMGKPSRAFFELVVAALGVEPAQAAMVGDDVESDVGGALAAGLAGVLVRTGKYTPDAERDAGVDPTATIDSIADLPDLLGSG